MNLINWNDLGDDLTPNKYDVLMPNQEILSFLYQDSILLLIVENAFYPCWTTYTDTDTQQLLIDMFGSDWWGDLTLMQYTTLELQKRYAGGWKPDDLAIYTINPNNSPAGRIIYKLCNKPHKRPPIEEMEMTVRQRLSLELWKIGIEFEKSLND